MSKRHSITGIRIHTTANDLSQKQQRYAMHLYCLQRTLGLSDIALFGDFRNWALCCRADQVYFLLIQCQKVGNGTLSIFCIGRYRVKEGRKMARGLLVFPFLVLTGLVGCLLS